MEDRTEPMAESGANGIAVHSGFPNAAVDRGSLRPALDFNQLLVHNPSSTFYFRIRGNAGESRGIFAGDIAVIDRALTPRASDLVLWWQGSDFCLSSPRRLPEGATIWGIVTSLIHQLRGQGESRP